MKIKLHQILPARKSADLEAHEAITRVHHKLSATAISGITRTYTPKDDDGDRYPNEHQKVTCPCCVDGPLGGSTPPRPT